MTKTDRTSDSEPIEEPLSATGMFLRAFGKEPEPPQEQSGQSPPPVVTIKETKQAAEPVLASSPHASSVIPASVEAQPGSPGEFTRLFQAAEPPGAVPQGQAVQPPVPSIEPKQMPPSPPGEFTRIFVKPAGAKPAERIASAPARTFSHPLPAVPLATGSPRMKGFSSGASDSASAEGSFTQSFQTPAPAPVPAPTPRVESHSPPSPDPATPAEEIKWPRQPDFSVAEGPVERGADTSSVTSLFASFGLAGQRQEEIKPRRAEPLPSFRPAPPAPPSTDESGSVTQLIQRLSEGVRTAPPEPHPAPVETPSPALHSGPGEYTRMISGIATKAPTGALGPPAAAPPAPAPFSIPLAAPPLAVPPAPKPAVPYSPPAMQTPKIEPPAAPAPNIVPPTVPAPAGKFQEMVPILLVINTFLLLVLILLTIFALRAK